MSVDALWVLAHATTDNAGNPTATFSQITDQNYNVGISEIIAGFDGEADNTYVVPGIVAPTIDFSSANIKACLDAVGSTGAAIVPTTNEFIAFFQKTAQGGVRAAATTNHLKLTMNEGILVPRSITVSDNGLATMSLSAVATYNGTDLPVVIADSQTYTASASGVVGWTLGPVNPNAVALAGVQQMTIDFGVELEVASGEGEGFPTYVTVMRRQPRITFTSKLLSAVATLTATGKAGLLTTVYLRKFDPAGGGAVRIADNVAEHVKITIAGDYESPRSLSGSHGSSANFAVDLIPKSTDGTNPFTISTVSAIT